MMGSGKSIVAKCIQEQLRDYKVVDMDTTIEHERNQKISDIFKDYGEVTFRNLEAELCRKISVNTKQIVSTGGGVVLNPENVNRLKASGVVFWLYADNETLYNRIKDEKHRPLINTSKDGEEVLATITSIMEKRFDLYRDMADVVINTSALSIEESCNEIRSEYKRLLECLK